MFTYFHHIKKEMRVLKRSGLASDGAMSVKLLEYGKILKNITIVKHSLCLNCLQ